MDLNTMKAFPDDPRQTILAPNPNMLALDRPQQLLFEACGGGRRASALHRDVRVENGRAGLDVGHRPAERVLGERDASADHTEQRRRSEMTHVLHVASCVEVEKRLSLREHSSPDRLTSSTAYVLSFELAVRRARADGRAHWLA